MGEFVKLRPKGLFAIIADAAFQDATIEPYEQEILKKISSYLKLDRKLATAIAIRSKTRYEEGKLGPEVPLDPKIVYHHALEVACADGKIDEIERKLLDALRKLFKISPDFHNGLLKRIQAALIEKARQEQIRAAEKEISVGETMKTANINVEANVQTEPQASSTESELNRLNEESVPNPSHEEGESNPSDAEDESYRSATDGEPLLPNQVKESIAAKAAAILADIDGWDDGAAERMASKESSVSNKKKPDKKEDGLLTSIGKWIKGD